MATVLRYWYIKLAIVVGAVVLGAQPMHASVATLSQTYYEQQMNASPSRSGENRLLEPAQQRAAVVVSKWQAPTSGASYSAARLQTGSSAKVQSYGEYAGYSHRGGDSHAAYNSLDISSGNVSSYILPTIGMRSTLRGKAYASADEAYDAATGKTMMRAPVGPGGGGPITGGDGTNKPGMVVPLGDAPWLMLILLMIAYAGMRRLRTVVCGRE